MVQYYFENNSFVIEDYHKAKAFSSFLPGIAGIKGIPMWTFYVNRGQGICSFGIRDKNSPIMEFSPANIAYKNVGITGFRTFIKNKETGKIYEAFHSGETKENIQRKMYIHPNGLELEEINEIWGLRIKVSYFHIPNEDFGGLVRKVKISNVGQEHQNIEVIDGMPEILPFGIENGTYKEIGNLMRSWMEVYNLENKIPYFKTRASTGDEAEVNEVTRGHFMLTFSDEEKLITPVVDYELIFGHNTSLLHPENFASKPLEEIQSSPQITANKVPCGFTGISRELGENETLNICTIIGHVADVQMINEKAKKITSLAYIAQKKEEAQGLIEALTDDIATKTSSSLFDAYCRQNYMDNFLRGGYPLMLDNEQEGFVYHVFSRKHGDLERDYNFFSLAPEYYSQGNGNFRDANQNRRNDIFFHPKAGSFNVKMFMNLIQADGYNPLSVEGCTFQIREEEKSTIDSMIEKYVDTHQKELKEILKGKFTPGKIINFIADHQVQLKIDEEVFLKKILSISKQNIEASFGEGFWIDHWTYNMDLVDSYLSIYPDKLEEFLLEDKEYTFFDSPVYVLPRKDKYVFSKGNVRQYGSLIHDEEKMKRLGIKINDTNWLRTKHGKGEIYYTNLLVKLLSLSLNKFTSLDPFGMGVEMEANKPGWNDAMNGLPGIFGSGISETFELKRIIQFLLCGIDQVNTKEVSLPVEMYELLIQIEEKLESYHSKGLSDFQYWDQVAELREAYREQIRFGIDGKEMTIRLDKIKSIYEKFLTKLDQGIQRAYQLGDGLYPTYLCFEATDYTVLKDEEGKEIISRYGLPKVKVNRFKVKALPYFLEGPARAMKTMNDMEQAEDIYEKVKQTELYDQKIKMYKTSVSLEDQSHEIGRIKAFTPGWLERESIFLHMSYKYLLELLKAGLYEAFFKEVKTSLVPFLDPKVYGRSTLENSSFIASSVNPDPNVHGRGFVARLSGSTAEFLSMWRYMMMGKEVFTVGNGRLQFQLSPVLPGWLFDEKGEVAFKLLGRTDVIYHNPEKGNTYGEDQVRIKKIILVDYKGAKQEIDSSLVEEEQANEIREGKIEQIHVYMEK